ncbi:signal peptidase I [Candidatus Saccharibacteria bacterium CPR2]|nr:signal peptidase I [Candidatus Saccharibacteria bacterium CPR2]
MNLMHKNNDHEQDTQTLSSAHVENHFDQQNNTLPNPLDDNIQKNNDDQKDDKKTPKSALSGFLSLAKLIVGAIFLSFLVTQFAFSSYVVFGQSMTPTLNDGDRLVVSKISKTWKTLTPGDYQPDRGDVIIFVSPINPNVQYIKRVIGLPGDRVVVKNGGITVYNEANPQGFDPDITYKDGLALTQGNVDVTVPDGELFVAGDNRTQGGSLDSRNELGTVPIDNIVGELWVRIFPISKMRVF